MQSFLDSPLARDSGNALSSNDVHPEVAIGPDGAPLAVLPTTAAATTASSSDSTPTPLPNAGLGTPTTNAGAIENAPALPDASANQ